MSPSNGEWCARKKIWYTDFLFFALRYLPLEDDYPGFIFGLLPSYRNVGRAVIPRGRKIHAKTPLFWINLGRKDQTADIWQEPRCVS